MSRVALELRRLRVRVGERVLVLDAPLTLRGGNVYLVQGPSGVGKSSLARALLGLAELVEPPLAVDGDVALFEGDASGGVPLLDERGFHEEARERLAFLPQAGSLGFIDELGVAANAALYSALPTDEAAEHREALARRFGLWPLPTSVAHASGGERMRLSALRALMPRGSEHRHPALLVADEPTTGLDAKVAEELARALLAEGYRPATAVVLITHDPGAFIEERLLPEADETAAIRVVECAVAQADEEKGDAPPHRLTAAREVGRFRVEEAPAPARVRPWLDRASRFADLCGAALLFPIAFVVGLVGLKRRILPALARDLLRTVANPGTWLFVSATTLLVSVTIGVFTFHLTPRRELIEPLIMPDILEGYGVALIAVVVPMFAAVFASAKNGAAGAARLAASVRGGLLDTLALARIRSESYALVPVVISHTLSLLLVTALACVLALGAGAFVFLASGSPLTLPQVGRMMFAGVEAQPGWLGWLVAKTLLSGAFGGMLAALFGLQPTRSEQDVALAVHRTLLWSGFAVLGVQCAFVVAQFG